MPQTGQTPASDQDTDGYYGDDDVSTEELDLSFLDQDNVKPKSSDNQK